MAITTREDFLRKKNNVFLINKTKKYKETSSFFENKNDNHKIKKKLQNKRDVMSLEIRLYKLVNKVINHLIHKK